MRVISEADDTQELIYGTVLCSFIASMTAKTITSHAQAHHAFSARPKLLYRPFHCFSPKHDFFSMCLEIIHAVSMTKPLIIFGTLYSFGNIFIPIRISTVEVFLKRCLYPFYLPCITDPCQERIRRRLNNISMPKVKKKYSLAGTL